MYMVNDAWKTPNSLIWQPAATQSIQRYSRGHISCQNGCGNVFENKSAYGAYIYYVGGRKPARNRPGEPSRSLICWWLNGVWEKVNIFLIIASNVMSNVKNVVVMS